MHAALVRRLIFPVALATRGELEYFRELRRLRAIEGGHAALDEVHRRRLHRALAVAREVTHYRSSLGDTPLPDDPEDRLTSFPLLTRSDLQANFASLKNPRVRHPSRKTTGGSTGQAVTVLKDRHAMARERAATAMGYSWFGIRMGDPALRFWGSASTTRRNVKSRLADLAMNRRTVSAFAFDDADLDRYWDLCLRLRPVYFYGYASMIEEFARHLHRRGCDGRSLGLRAIICTAEPLTSSRREIIREVFGVPIQNEYGCGEVGPIAYECPAGSLHVMSHNLRVEIVSDTGERCPPGVVGRVIVTDLNNQALPLIRYVVGDQAAWGSGCRCNLPFPVLSEVVGRQYDYLEDSRGRRYHGEAVMYIFEDLRDQGFTIPSFQVLQEKPGHVRLLLVAPQAPEALDDLLQDLFRDRLGGIELAVERRREIPRAPSGKRRLIRRLS